MNNYPYIIIDDTQELLAISEIISEFPAFTLLSSGSTTDALDITIGLRPKVVFYNVTDLAKFVLYTNDLYRYFKDLPRVIAICNIDLDNWDDCFQVLSFPLNEISLIKCLLKFERTYNDSPWATNILKPFTWRSHNGLPTQLEPIGAQQEAGQLADPVVSANEGAAIAEQEEQKIKDIEVKDVVDIHTKPLTICVKSYGDYRFIEADDIAYLKADNNSTDIHLNNGEMITAFKTLKHFENVLNNPFVRIHNSYIVNINYVSRIHTGNSVCYLKHSGIKLPFSKSYKENIDSILQNITRGNYLEI